MIHIVKDNKRKLIDEKDFNKFKKDGWNEFDLSKCEIKQTTDKPNSLEKEVKRLETVNSQLSTDKSNLEKEVEKLKKELDKLTKKVADPKPAKKA